LGHCPFTQPLFYVFTHSVISSPVWCPHISAAAHSSQYTIPLLRHSSKRPNPPIPSILYRCVPYSILLRRCIHYDYIHCLPSTHCTTKKPRLKSTWSPLFVFNTVQYIYVLRLHFLITTPYYLVHICITIIYTCYNSINISTLQYLLCAVRTHKPQQTYCTKTKTPTLSSIPAVNLYQIPDSYFYTLRMMSHISLL
jgi:hypothetical protein